ncbi:MAG: hypothetical protein HZA30_05610 [Candidatus Omnitrophica bacterium]|nr:hypothetical protein [Candidatus Omnitrophota bacterium]
MRRFKGIRFKIFLTVFLVYLFYIAPDYITATTNRYVILTKSIVEDGVFYVDKYYKVTRDLAPYKDHYYIGAAPGPSFMAVPIYMALRPLLQLIPQDIYQDLELNILNLFFGFFLSVLPGALTAVLLYGILEEFKLREKERILMVFASAFGTILFYYSTRFTSHAISAFMLLSAFYIIFKSKHTDAKIGAHLFFLAGICSGIAVLSEYNVFIGFIMIMLYAFLNFRKEKISQYLGLIIGAAIVAGLSMYYHYKCFDNFFASATTYSRLIGPVPFSLPRLTIMYELTFGTYRGLFIYMPIFLISIYGIFVFFTQPEKRFLPEMTFTLLYSLLMFLALSIFCNKAWPLGGDFGPRYFISFMPFLIIPIAFAFKKIKYNVMLWIAVLSIFINWCGVQYGDADNAFTDVGLFLLQGLNSNLCQWLYKSVSTHIRPFGVVTHFSPFVPFLILLAVIYLIWKDELWTVKRVKLS